METMFRLFFLSAVLLSSTAWSQPTLDWAFGIGAASGDAVIGQTLDGAGNLYTVGYFSGTMDLNPGPGFLNVSSAGGTDIFILKMDASGNFIWGKRIGGIWADRANDVAVDNSGNVFVTGSFRNTVDFDPGPGVYNRVADNVIQSAAVFVVKLNSSGTFQWARTADTQSQGYALDTDDAGNVYVAGSINGWVDFGTTSIAGDIFFWKLNASGDQQWAKALDDVSSSFALSVGLHGMKVDGSGNIYAAGTFNGTQDFSPGNGVFNLVSNGSNDAYILKLDNAGTFQWVKQYGGTSLDYGLALHRSSNGDLFLAGVFSGISDFDPGSGTGEFAFQSAGSTDIFALKTDANGNVQWASAFGGSEFDYVGDISANDVGEVVVTGTFQGTADFDPDLVGTLNYTSVGGDDIFIEKLSSTGELQWARTFGSTNADQGWSILCGSGNSIYAGGGFYSTIDFDPSAAVYNLTSAASADMYLLKFGECTATTSTISPTSCESYTSPSGNYTWTSTNIYTDTIPNNAGCDSIITVNLTIQDALAPMPDLATLSNVSAQCEVTSLTAPTATDNCAGSITGTQNASFPITSSTTITWTYDDGNGNTSTQTQEVVVNDNTAPVADSGTLADVTGQCEVTSLSAPTATDNCEGSITGTHNASLPITSSTTITWTFDDGNGNTSTQTQDVVVADTTAPVANVASLSNVTAECSVTSLTTPTATDNCAGPITGTHNATLPITTQGTTTVTWTYDDGNGNSSTQTQDIVIGDVTAPIANVASLSNVTSECSVTSLAAPTATDNCAGSITGTHNAALPITTQGTTTVTWTYDDGNGNTATQTQDVVIEDTNAPAADIASLLNVTSDCSVTSLTAPTATDNCAGSITGTHNASLPITTQGTTTVTWTYDDGNGNTSTQTQDIVINDDTAPSADLANLSVINAECDVTPTAPTATDNCSGLITGTSDVVFPITSSGTTTITWTYEDENGNTSTQTQEVVITPIDDGITQIDAVTLSANAAGYSYQWLDCDNGNQAIDGATDPTFTATNVGNYAVEISNGNCTVTSGCISLLTVGIEGSHTMPVSVYPNPTFGNLIIDLGNIYGETKIKVFNALGQTVINAAFGTTDRINLNIDGPPGIYILEINQEGGNSSKVKVIKE